MIENVDKNVDFPRAGVAEIALAHGASGPLTEESQYGRQIAGHLAGVVIGKGAPMPCTGALERQGRLVQSRVKKPPPEPREHEGGDIEHTSLVALNEG
jgi:hypothetical protein